MQSVGLRSTCTSGVKVRLTNRMESQPLAAGMISTPPGLLSSYTVPLIVRLSPAHSVCCKFSVTLLSKITLTVTIESQPLAAGKTSMPLGLS